MKRTLQFSALGILVAFNLLATARAVLAVQPPAWLWPPVRFFHGIIAPYPGFTTYLEDFVVEGKEMHGTWTVIPMGSYLPVPPTERTYRLNLVTFLPHEDLRMEKFRELLQKIWAREDRRGHLFTALRLRLLEWPVSANAHAHNRIPPLTTSTTVLTIP